MYVKCLAVSDIEFNQGYNNNSDDNNNNKDLRNLLPYGRHGLYIDNIGSHNRRL